MKVIAKDFLARWLFFVGVFFIVAGAILCGYSFDTLMAGLFALFAGILTSILAIVLRGMIKGGKR